MRICVNVDMYMVMNVYIDVHMNMDVDVDVNYLDDLCIDGLKYRSVCKQILLPKGWGFGRWWRRHSWQGQNLQHLVYISFSSIDVTAIFNRQWDLKAETQAITCCLEAETQSLLMDK